MDFKVRPEDVYQLMVKQDVSHAIQKALLCELLICRYFDLFVQLDMQLT